MSITIDRNFVRSLVRNLRARIGTVVKHTEVMDDVAKALGWRTDALMHALKAVDAGYTPERTMEDDRNGIAGDVEYGLECTARHAMYLIQAIEEVLETEPSGFDPGYPSQIVGWAFEEFGASPPMCTQERRRVALLLHMEPRFHRAKKRFDERYGPGLLDQFPGMGCSGRNSWPAASKPSPPRPCDDAPGGP